MNAAFRPSINVVHRVHLHFTHLRLLAPRLLPVPLRQLASPIIFHRGMKRKATDSGLPAKLKRPREQLPDYCDAEPQRDNSGAIIWPAPERAIEDAREFLREW